MRVIENVIDFLFTDFKSLKKKKRVDHLTKEEKEELRAKELGL